jgi:hypothetical protein
LQDLIDVDDVPMSSRPEFAKELDGIFQDLRENGASVYSATRDRKFRNDIVIAHASLEPVVN